MIDDPHDVRVADFVGLTDARIRQSAPRNPFFIAEGLEVVRRLITSDIHIRSIVVAPNRLEALSPSLTHVRCPVYVANRNVLSNIVGFDLHRGVIASATRPPPIRLDDVLDAPPRNGERHRVVALHGVGDHENVGAIIRSARALAVDGLVLDPTCCDAYYRRSVRVSMGEIFFLPIISMAITDLIPAIRARAGITTALTPRADAMPIAEVTKDHGPHALVFGSEGRGLPSDILDAADRRVRIPIATDVDSLNVGHAAAIALAIMA